MKCKNGQNPDWNKTEMEKFNIAVTKKNLFSFSGLIRQKCQTFTNFVPFERITQYKEIIQRNLKKTVD
jgi:hypothetical protein